MQTEDFQNFDVVAYSDGAGGGKGGLSAGGWAGVLHCMVGKDLHSIEISGGVPDTTSNRMEITAILEIIKKVQQKSRILIYSDSKYCVQSIGHWNEGYAEFISPGWVHSWRARNWLTATNEPVKNIDLWEEVIREIERHTRLEMRWVRGHNDNPWNERCDELAVTEKLKLLGKPYHKKTKKPSRAYVEHHRSLPTDSHDGVTRGHRGPSTGGSVKGGGNHVEGTPNAPESRRPERESAECTDGVPQLIK
jgi:ribonuclease HI